MHLMTTPSGLPVAHALAGAGEDERDMRLEIIARVGIARRGQTIIVDKGYRSARFAEELNAAGIELIRPAAKAEPDADSNQGPTSVGFGVEPRWVGGRLWRGYRVGGGAGPWLTSSELATTGGVSEK